MGNFGQFTNRTDVQDTDRVVGYRVAGAGGESRWTWLTVRTWLAQFFAPAEHLLDTSNPHAVTKVQVGLGNVSNLSPSDLPISAAAQAALDEKADIGALAAKADLSALTAHASSTTNPHAVTKAQVGLGSVDNTSDANKPVSTAQAAAIATKADASALLAHTGDSNNPHAVTKAQVGLGAVPNVDATNASNMASGTLPAARGGAGTVSGILKADGAGNVSAADPETDYIDPQNFPGNPIVGHDITEIAWVAGFEAKRLPVVADGAPVSSWGDFSGNARNASPVSTAPVYKVAANGINGKPVVRFSGAEYMQVAAGGLSMLGDFYMAVVMRPTALAGNQHVVCFGDATSGERRGIVKIAPSSSDIPNVYSFNDEQINYPPDSTSGRFPTEDVAVVGTAVFVEVFKVGTTIDVWANGVVVGAGGSTANVAFASDQIFLGANVSGGEKWVGDIALALFKSSIPSTAELSFLRGYVQSNYGMPVAGQNWQMVPYYKADGSIAPSGFADDGTGNMSTLAGKGVTINGQLKLPSGANGKEYTTFLREQALNNTTSKELLLKAWNAAENMLAVRNLDPAGYSAYTARDYLGNETLAIGYGNPQEGAGIFAGYNYLQSWAATAPKPFRFTLDGNYGPVGSGFRFYQRWSMEDDGFFYWWKLIPWGAAQEKVFRFEDGGIRWGGISTGPLDTYGSGSPEGVVTAPPGSIYRNTSGGAGTTLYVKESGTGNTGWVAK